MLRLRDAPDEKLPMSDDLAPWWCPGPIEARIGGGRRLELLLDILLDEAGVVMRLLLRNWLSDMMRM